eukprot:755541-Hanusia_phi.AAC.3
MTTSETTAPDAMANATLSAALTQHISESSNSPHRVDVSPPSISAESVASSAVGNFRPCPQHVSEKLTLYSSRARCEEMGRRLFSDWDAMIRCFGCVKCFQEGVLRGHQAQSLQTTDDRSQRSVVEAKEKVQRQSANYDDNDDYGGEEDYGNDNDNYDGDDDDDDDDDDSKDDDDDDDDGDDDDG